MATFVTLITMTEHGEHEVQKTVERADAFREAAKKAGVEVKDIYWTMGGFDGVVVFDAPDDQKAASLILSLGSKGSVRTQTLRAFDRDEIATILESVE